MPYIELDVRQPIWDQVYMVAPLVLVGTMEADGSHDLAPKHLAMPMSWQSWFGFVCTPRHATWRNAVRTGVFTVSFPSPEAILPIVMAAGPRVEGGEKPTLAAVEVEPAQKVDGVLVKGCGIALECELHRTVDDLGENSLIIGKVVAARVDAELLRGPDTDDNDLVHRHPLLAFLYPDRFATIDATNRLPYHTGFER